MPDVEGLQKSVQSVLDSMRSYVEAASDLIWSPSDGFLPIVHRAILRRQFDSLEAISHLVAEGKGYAAAPLLRPACEEFIWVKYLAAISVDESEELLRCVASGELLASLKAQDDFGGRTVTTELGLAAFLDNAQAREDHVRAQLRTLGRKLDWPARAIEGGQLPGVSWLAGKTGERKVYKFLYHASSRFVHFSAAELLRRAWGRPGSVSVRSVHFSDYWSAFALYWGLRLFLDTVIQLCQAPEMPEGKLNEADLLSAVERIGAFGQIPIVTAEELAWPERGDAAQ